MANALFVKGAEKILSGAVNLATDTIKVALVKSAYVVNLATHEFYSDLGANVLNTPQTLISKTVSGGKFNAANPTFSAVTAGDTALALVLYKDTSGAPAAPVANAPTTAVSGGSLAAGTYYYKVTALGVSGESIPSNEVSIASANLAAPVANTPTTATTGGTLAAATYYYKVTALGVSGETIASNEVSIATTGTTSTATVTWAAVTGASGYRVYRGTAAGAENVYYTPGNVTTFTDTGAANTAGSPPGANTAVSATNTVTVTWPAVTGASGYRVYRGTAAGAENVYYTPGNVTTFTDTGAASVAGNPPAAGTSPLLAYIDTITGFPLATNGGDVTPQWDAGTYKIFSLV